MKKSYNAFKMVGAWSGAVIYSLLAYFTSQEFFSKTVSENIQNILFFPSVLVGSFIEMISPTPPCFSIICFGISFVVMILSVPVFGFLAGWGIHSWIRKASN